MDPRVTRIVLIAALAMPSGAVAGQAVATSIAQARLTDSTDHPPRIGDTVVIAGRVAIGSGVLDTAQLVLYLQDSSAAIRVYAGPQRRYPLIRTGDSVIATGRVMPYRGEIELTAASVVVANAPPLAPKPIPVTFPRVATLDSASSRLVTVSGTVIATRVGRGDQMVKIGDPAGPESAAILVVDDNYGNAHLRLDRYQRGDRVKVTGVPVRRLSRESAAPRYYVYPRSDEDVVPLGWTQATRRSVALALLGLAAVLVMLIVGRRVRRALREQRDRVAAAQQESALRYRRLVEEAPVGIVVYRAGAILFANAEFASMFAVESAESLRGKRLFDVVHEEDRARVQTSAQHRTADVHGVFRDQESFRRLDGRPIVVSVVSCPTVFEGTAAMQAVMHDITTQRALEAQVTQSQRMEAVGQLAAGIAHDFNNILTAIGAYSQLMLDELPSDSSLRDDVEEIQRASRRANDLTKQLLVFSHRHEVQRTVIDLNDVIRAAEPLLRKGIGVAVDLEVALTDAQCLVCADGGQLEQVLFNLVFNARDAMPSGGVVRVETSVANKAHEPSHADSHSSDGGTRFVVLRVCDTGAGMDAETLAHVFEPFFTTKRVGEGAGLGLSSVYGIVTASGGQIAAQSCLGRGATFVVSLPFVEGTVTVPSLPPSFAASPHQRARILLVDDEAPVRNAARRILERAGYTVYEAKNAQDAVTLWDECSNDVDCIVSDVVMPGMRGPQMVECLRRTKPDVPVLFISGYTDGATGILDTGHPVSAVLAKPFQPGALVEAVERLMARHSAHT